MMILAVLVMASMAEAKMSNDNSYGYGYGDGYYGYGYGYNQSGAKVEDKKTGMKIESRGWFETLAMRSRYDKVLDISASEREKAGEVHYSELPNTPLGQNKSVKMNQEVTDKVNSLIKQIEELTSRCKILLEYNSALRAENTVLKEENEKLKAATK